MPVDDSNSNDTTTMPEDDSNNNDTTTMPVDDSNRQEELLALVRTLQAEKKDLQAANEKLRENDKKGSLQAMIEKFNGLPDMPEVADLFPHEHANIPTPFSVDAGLVTENDLNFPINFTYKEDGKSIPATLLLNHHLKEKDGAEILSYGNEATVSDYVQSVVTMCLHSLGLFKECVLCKEMTLFSLRPDLILVLHPEKGIILIIEVKMPGEALFQSGNIATQVAEYLVLQYRLGNHMPLVLLASYREACLCHLSPDCLDDTRTSEEEEEADDTGSVEGGGGDNNPSDPLYRKLIVEEAIKLISGDSDLTAFMGAGGGEKKGSEKPTNHSPMKTAFRARELIPYSLSEGTAERRKRGRSPTIKYVTPRVVYSKPFALNNMMQGVSLAIVSGLVSLQRKEAPSLEEFWPSQGHPVDGLHPCVESESLKWANVKDMPIDYTKGLQGSDDKYILLQEIGRGQNGRVYLGVDVDGNAVALKFYLHNVDSETSFSPAARDKDRAEAFEKTKSKAKKELKRWNDLQPGFDEYLRHLKLNRQNVLKMPVFAPVPLKERRNVLPAVEEKLRGFLVKGLVYKELRWQHIGCRRKRGTAQGNSDLEIVLLDLESLKKREDVPVLADHVSDQIEKLRDRIESVDSRPTNPLFGARASAN